MIIIGYLQFFERQILLVSYGSENYAFYSVPQHDTVSKHEYKSNVC